MGNQGLGQKKEVIKHQPTEFINQNQGTLVATLREGKVLKSFLYKIPQNGPFVVKMYFRNIKSETNSKDFTATLTKYHTSINTMADTLTQCPNLIVSQPIPMSEGRGYMLVRQYIARSLREKFISIPRMGNAEKKWVSYQLIRVVRDMHERKCCHGDIKAENIVLSSWNWLFLTDLAVYKPVGMRTDDIIDIYKSFYGSEGGEACTFAPERFVDGGDVQPERLEYRMDIFSLGCVIAEVFLDGKVPLFDLAQLLDYKRSGILPKVVENKLEKMEDEFIYQLVLNMIQLHPQRREAADHYLNLVTSQFPPSFPLYFQLFSSILTSPISGGDQRVAFILNYIPHIWKSCFGKPPPQLLPRFSSSISHTFIHINIQQPNLRQTADKDSIIVIIYFLYECTKTCRFPTTKIVIIDFLHAISKEMNWSFNLQIIVPSLIEFMKDNSVEVQGRGLEVLLDVLENIDENAQLFLTDFNLLSQYIAPAIFNLVQIPSPSNFITLLFASRIGHIAKILHKILELGVLNQLIYMQNNIKQEEEKESNIISYDQELESIKEKLSLFITKVIKSNNELHCAQLFPNLFKLAEVFGDLFIDDPIIPSIISCLQLPKITLLSTFYDSIKLIAGRISPFTLKHLIIPKIHDFGYYHSEEVVFYSSIRSMNDLLNSNYLDEDLKVEELKKIVFMLMHPNCWIHEQALKYLEAYTFNHKTTSIPSLSSFMVEDLPFYMLSTLNINQFIKPPFSKVIYNLAKAGYDLTLIQNNLLSHDKMIQKIFSSNFTENYMDYCKQKEDELGPRQIAFSLVLQDAQKMDFLEKKPEFSKKKKNIKPDGRIAEKSKNREDWRHSGELVKTLYEHKSPVIAVAVSIDSRYFLTGSSDGYINLWDAHQITNQDMKPIDEIKLKTGELRTLSPITKGGRFMAGTSLSVEIYSISGDIRLVDRVKIKGEGGVVGIECYGEYGEYGEEYEDMIYVTEGGFIHTYIYNHGRNRERERRYIGVGRGVPSCMCLDVGKESKDRLAYIGTLSGYLLLFNLHFLCITAAYKSAPPYPISALAALLPSPQSTHQHFLFLASAAPTMQLALYAIHNHNVITKLLFTSTHIHNPFTIPTLLFQLQHPHIVNKYSGFEERVGEVNLENIYIDSMSNYEPCGVTNRIICLGLNNWENCEIVTGGGDGEVRMYWREGEGCKYSMKQLATSIQPRSQGASFGKCYVLQEESHNPSLGNNYSHMHSDAILDLQFVIGVHSTYLVTLGRDHLVKIWN